jgi:replicative DNA helicase
MNNSPLSNDSLLESIGNIVKASNADVYAEQVLKLKECNRELIKRLEEIKRHAEKINEHTFETYKQQILLTIENETDFIKKAKLI